MLEVTASKVCPRTKSLESFSYSPGDVICVASWPTTCESYVLKCEAIVAYSIRNMSQFVCYPSDPISEVVLECMVVSLGKLSAYRTPALNAFPINSAVPLSGAPSYGNLQRMG